MPTTAHAQHIAFQPIVEGDSGAAFAYEALVPTPAGVSLLSIADQIAFEQRRFDAAIGAAVAAGIDASDALLAIPVTPCEAPSQQLTQLFRAAVAHRFPVDRLVVQVCANGNNDPEQLETLLHACAARGIAIAFDHFSAGPRALRLLTRFSPRFLKLDEALTRGIDRAVARQAVIEGVLRMGRAMAIPVVAQGIASDAEVATLYNLGIASFQGEWIAPASHQLQLPTRAAARLAPPPRREARTPAHPHRRVPEPHRAIYQPEALACTA